MSETILSLQQSRSRNVHRAEPINIWHTRVAYVLLTTLLLILESVYAQNVSPFNSALAASNWSAAWIACPGTSQKDLGVFYFRKEFTLSVSPAHFWVHVSADNRFLLHVNGRYAAEGPARGDLFHWRFETIDLAPLLHPGANVLAAIVWNFGTEAPVAQMSNRTGFLLQGDTTFEEIANTNFSWQTRREVGRGISGLNSARGYYAAGPGETIDGRTLDWSWDSDQLADTSPWQPAIAIGHGAAREALNSDNNWALVQDALPPVEHRRTSAGRTVRTEGISTKTPFPDEELSIPSNTHATLLLDSGALQTAYPMLTTSGGANAEIRITYSEAMYDHKGDKGNRNDIDRRHIEGISDDFISDGGDNRAFQPLWWRTWRYLQIDVTTKSSPIKLDNLSAWFTAYPFEEKASIEGDISQLKQLWDIGWRTARLDAHETYMDAPYWEQLQYVGDARIQALISYAMTGDSRLARQAIMSFDDSRIIEGLTQSRYPSVLPQFIPTFSLLWIDMLHDYWMYTTNSALVRDTIPHTRSVIDWYVTHIRPDGLLGKMPWWEFGDWTKGYTFGVPPEDADGGSAFLTLQLIEALRDASMMEAAYGSPERVAQYQQIIRKATISLNHLTWDEQYGVYADTPAKKSYSQEANILAVWLNVAPGPKQASILRRTLASKEDTAENVNGRRLPAMSQMSYYFRFYLSRALDHAGLGDEYLHQLGPWYSMLELGLTTWAETPEPTRSDCHAWSASPNYDLLTLVAGITPDAPGFTRVRVEPHLGNVTHLDANMPHPNGNIHVLYTRNSRAWNISIALPKDLSGSFVWQTRSYPLHEGAQTLHIPISH